MDRQDYRTNHLIGHLWQGAAGREDEVFAELDDGATVSFSDLFSLAGRYAAVLADHDVKPGDRVLVQVEKSIEGAALYLGTVLAGAIYLPLNTAYLKSELEFFVGDSAPQIIVCDPSNEEALRTIASSKPVLTLDGDGSGSLANAAEKAGPGSVIEARGPEDAAAILYTSGTTGRSKGAVLSHRALVSNALVLRDYWQITSDDCLIHALPIYHVHGLFVALNPLLCAGAKLLFRRRFDAESVIRDMSRATMLMGVPTFYTRLLDRPELGPESAANMRVFVSGSAPLLAQTHRQWQERTGHRILERYGMTETGMNTSNPYDGERRPGTVGFPLPGIELRVVDAESGRRVAAGTTGSIEVRGPNLFSGYWRMPEKTAEEHRKDGFFITGDLGTFSRDGYLSIVGRAKDLIITGGLNVYPKEIEALIDKLDGVGESAVIGVPHRDFGEAIVAVVVPSGDDVIAEDGIREALAEKIAKFKQPKCYFLVEELPRNTMGKVQKNVLRERYHDAFAEE